MRAFFCGLAARHLRCVGAEDVLEGAEPLASQLVPVAEKERAVELARLRDSLEEEDGDSRLARTGGQGEKRPLLALRELFEHCVDGGILEVVAAGLASGVTREERTGLGRLQAEPHALLVADTEGGRRRKFVQGPRLGREACRSVELDEEVAIRGEDELDVESAAGRIGLGLLETVSGLKMFGLRLDEGHGHRLARLVHPNAQGIVHASLGAVSGSPFHNLNCPSRLLASDKVFRPPTGVERRVDQLGPSVGLAQGHARPL
jgi:hypothetical protein